MANLVPQKRTDKNNRVVTRWVKPEAAAGPSLNKLPSPGIRRESLNDKRSRLFESCELGNLTGSEVFRIRFEEQIAKMPEPALDRALEALDKHQDSSRVNYAVRHAINKWAKSDADSTALETSIQFAEIESVYEKYLKPSPLGNPQRATDLEEGITSSLLVRANDDSFENLPQRPLTEEESDQAVIAGYAAATVELHVMNISKDRFAKSDFWDFFQRHGDLVGVFSEFRDRMDEVIDYVYQNGPDAGQARQYLRGDHMALSGGAL